MNNDINRQYKKRKTCVDDDTHEKVSTLLVIKECKNQVRFLPVKLSGVFFVFCFANNVNLLLLRVEEILSCIAG